MQQTNKHTNMAFFLTYPNLDKMLILIFINFYLCAFTGSVSLLAHNVLA